jgi:hypothetical protein
MIKKCLKSLKENCVILGLKEIAMPRICSGCDGIQWHIIKDLIETIFNGTGITVYIITPPENEF